VQWNLRNLTSRESARPESDPRVRLPHLLHDLPRHGFYLSLRVCTQRLQRGGKIKMSKRFWSGNPGSHQERRLKLCRGSAMPEHMMTSKAGRNCKSWRKVCNPSISGIFTSSRTTSVTRRRATDRGPRSHCSRVPPCSSRFQQRTKRNAHARVVVHNRTVNSGDILREFENIHPPRAKSFQKCDRQAVAKSALNVMACLFAFRDSDIAFEAQSQSYLLRLV